MLTIFFVTIARASQPIDAVARPPLYAPPETGSPSFSCYFRLSLFGQRFFSEGYGVAANSLHTYGKALDIVSDAELPSLKRAAIQ
jgi:hypothetical protein